MADLDRIAAMLEGQGQLLREVRNDTKRIDARTIELLTWRNGHIRDHEQEAQTRRIWQNRLWALVAPYALGAVVALVWVVARTLGLV